MSDRQRQGEPPLVNGRPIGAVLAENIKDLMPKAADPLGREILIRIRIPKPDNVTPEQNEIIRAFGAMAERDARLANGFARSYGKLLQELLQEIRANYTTKGSQENLETGLEARFAEFPKKLAQRLQTLRENNPSSPEIQWIEDALLFLAQEPAMARWMFENAKCEARINTERAMIREQIKQECPYMTGSSLAARLVFAIETAIRKKTSRFTLPEVPEGTLLEEIQTMEEATTAIAQMRLSPGTIKYAFRTFHKMIIDKLQPAFLGDFPNPQAEVQINTQEKLAEYLVNRKQFVAREVEKFKKDPPKNEIEKKECIATIELSTAFIQMIETFPRVAAWLFDSAKKDATESLRNEATSASRSSGMQSGTGIGFLMPTTLEE